ncbi:uncharacterized protein GGS22DRAFT_45020 [Annulohypoxylon maeteangense]|uniref:uncharacterized protein n=1 Tax=Annulohypoxylon maeteangense TaxID=1927788 RepID=UPI0020080207|nr:uncharacterized protein GGS22DRAFT_45020 [Annulohypoxylon maeteangense]KAI0882483.1 hypothetical protein GGS22DRAFT_45020 [Annulohypoxylon maeteangense]
MASDTRRPQTEYGGSRPPMSRFLEGSMNDRVSATPPPQYLGPEELREYEKQFYTDRPMPQSEPRKPRRHRPFSESSVPETNEHDRIITHRKSTSFFERVREALRWTSSSRSSTSSHKQDSVRKHTSLQEVPLSPRLDNLRAAKSHPEIPYHNLPELPNFGSGANRPTREDVMQSYSQLMASGFFQSHAIQSTRHAGPGARDDKRRPIPQMPTIPGSAPCTPKTPRISSIEFVESPNSFQSPTKATRRERTVMRLEPEHEHEDELYHAVKNNNSRHNSLRGRKRNRVDTEEVGSPEVPGATTSSSFAQPLKRVAKKLRKMPSSARDVEMSDAMVSLPPSTSVGGTMYLKERPVRMREPSPTPPGVSNRRTDYQHHGHFQPKPRRTLSGSSKGEGNRLRKRGKSGSHRSRDLGFETWEMEGERRSSDSIHQDSTSMSEAEAAQELARSREATSLRIVPDVNRGIPSVPRIPDQYHFYHKPNSHYDFENENENENPEWRFGEAL